MQFNPRQFGMAAVALFIATSSAVATAQLASQGEKLPKAQAASLAGPLQTERRFNRLIIKFKDQAATRAGVFDSHSARNQVALLDSSAALKLPKTSAGNLTYLKSVTTRAHVVVTNQRLNRAELVALTKQIEQDPNVAYAEIDEIAHALFTPNDPDYLSQQWHYQAPATFPGGANLPKAWDLATGAGVVVAVIDGGVRPHVDLAASLLPGYDFIGADSPGVFTTANDGDGRDSDASDPGDWALAGACGAGSPASDSTWHGTHIAGTIAAVTNNGVGVAGVAFGAKLLPVRVLGVCGGYASDVAAGMRWAAGLSVPGVPANPNKAKVLNLSLGDTGPCLSVYQDAVNDVRAAGSTVVAASGNDGFTSISQPASCTGVIAVTAHTKQGDNADYANIGAGTAISGPGGGFGAQIPGDGALVYSTLNTGLTTPGADSYGGYAGTSMAAAHVAGVAALLASLQPTLSPDALNSVLISSARAYPAATFCATRSDCGAGLVDARAAIDRLNSTAPVVAAQVNQPGVRPTGSTISFTATAVPGSSGNTTFSYQWTQLAGPAVNLKDATSATASFVAPTPGASYTFKVKITDGAGLSATNQVSVRSNTAPVLNPIAAQTVAQGGNLGFTASATDAENNPVMFLASGLPTGASLDPATGVFIWNAASPAGNYAFTLTPNDGTFNGIAQTVSLTVTAPVDSSRVASGSGGGGGAISWLDVFALLLLAGLSLYWGRHQGTRGKNQ